MHYPCETLENNLPGKQGEETRSGGWFISGMYRHAFLEQHRAARRSSGADSQLHEQRYVRGNRLYVSAAYCDERGEEQFAWLLYLPVRCEEQAARHALNCLQACAAFEDQHRPDKVNPRVQEVLAKQA